MLKDPTGSIIEEKLKGIETPAPPMQCIPEFVMVRTAAAAAAAATAALHAATLAAAAAAATGSGS